MDNEVFEKLTIKRFAQLLVISYGKKYENILGE